MRKDFAFVGVQMVLFLLYTLDLWVVALDIPVIVKQIGAIVASVGVLVIVISMLQLNKNLSPFPTPKTDGELITTGLFSLIRHPIYTGIITMCLGYGIFQANSWKLLITLILYIFFYIKSTYEESMLITRFKDYNNYKLTTGRFLPAFKRK